jgi:hypothetical protein
MIYNLLLALDLSTTATGFAFFDIETGELLEKGVIKITDSKFKGLTYPEKQLQKMKAYSYEIMDIVNLKLIEGHSLKIIIEEVNRHKSRMTGKTLDGLHWILLNEMLEDTIKTVSYVDSDGLTGWRTTLGLFLTETDKLVNKDHRAKNKKRPKGSKKLPIITKKDLACRFANKHYNLDLDCVKKSTDGDIADAIGLGASFLLKRELTKP